RSRRRRSACWCSPARTSRRVGNSTSNWCTLTQVHHPTCAQAHQPVRATMMTTPDLSTTYLGLHLRNPLVPSASPLGRSLDNLRRMEDAGAGAVVLPSLFEEQIDHESHELD